jgi:PleD family two-component response regulator
LLERIRANAGQLEEVVVPVTATVAVGVFGPHETFREAFKRTDQLLYQGKQAGRNRVMADRAG